MHLIHRQLIELECASERQALDLQKEVTNLCETALPLALDQLFDRYVGARENLQIETLNIELKDLKVERFSETFIPAVVEAIENQLVTAKSEAVLPNFKALLYFLKFGNLPWWANFNSLEDLKTAAWKEINNIQLSVLQNFTTEIFTFKNARQRLWLQLGEAFAVQLFTKLNKIRWQSLSSWSEFLIEWLKIKKKEQIIIFDWATQAFFTNPDISIYHFLKTGIQMLQAEAIVQKTFKTNDWQAQIPQHIIERVQMIEALQQVFNSIEEKIPGESGKNEDSNAEKELQNIMLEGVYISNAGMVLLAPFLQEYLRACGVVENEDLTDKSSAVHFLQYLIVGEKISSEYELALNKLLCNLPLDAPLPLETAIPEVVQEQAENLLNAVICYWDALKNTSIEGLRESFLQRPGKLIKREEDWLLQVEQRGYDMLLEHLPWTYSIVHLPWMPQPIWVEWT